MPPGAISNAVFPLSKTTPSTDAYFVLPASTSIRSRDVQPANTAGSRLVTEAGMTADVNDVQPAKAWLPIVRTPSGMLVDFNDVQFENA